MPSNNFDQLINMLLQMNPRIQNNPQAQSMLNVIRSGDAVTGQQLAENLCKTYGITTQEATQQAKIWLQNMMNRR